MPLDPYEGFADRYDRFFAKPPEEDPVYEAFFRSLFEENHVRRVLDCACGTGRDLPLFRSLGCEVHASDASAAMLAQARTNLAALDIQVPLQKADFRKLPEYFDTPFDGVVCLRTSLPHLLREAEILRALSSMRDVIHEGGVLVLTQGMTDRRFLERPRFIPIINTADFSRVSVIDYFRHTYCVNILDLVHDKDTRDFKMSSFHYRVLRKDDYARLLHQVGYRAVHFYGSYSFDPYDARRSGNLIVVARK